MTSVPSMPLYGIVRAKNFCSTQLIPHATRRPWSAPPNRAEGEARKFPSLNARVLHIGASGTYCNRLNAFTERLPSIEYVHICAGSCCRLPQLFPFYCRTHCALPYTWPIRRGCSCARDCVCGKREKMFALTRI